MCPSALLPASGSRPGELRSEAAREARRPWYNASHFSPRVCSRKCLRSLADAARETDNCHYVKYVPLRDVGVQIGLQPVVSISGAGRESDAGYGSMRH